MSVGGTNRQRADAKMMNGGYSNESVNAVVYGSKATEDFSQQDWLDLALAALDQAGVKGAAFDSAYKAVERLAEPA